ncbi:Ral GTPase-activating protein subunit alpha-2 [Clonorchis sinensis]|uniref:Ral GTPase-activating protein subunit alpha-2 n=1 Tax=Clonorchis sinensis TaxID=79923 RepID=G7YHZ2_CLOSI|nr:Ral GTPase-activating protein subunit alpha-2 [Clonorchis sinensis]
MDRVFRRHKASEGSVEKSQRKFLADKESSQKLKHLRILIGQLPSTELQNFFVENRSYIFHIFTDSFWSVEQELRQKVSPTNLKELENVLVVFEKILLLLPEYIREKWQYNGIMDVLDQLLNERNAVSVRKFGIRLFLLWYQILGDKATPKCHKMFTSLVPNFGFWISEYQKRSKPDTSGSISGTGKKNALPPVTSQPKANFGITPGDNGVLVPSVQVEEQQSNQDLEQTLLQHFLSSLVSEVAKVSWKEQQQEKHLMQLWFLFEQLKRTYLPVVFPCLSPAYTVYEPFDPKPLGPSPGLLDSLQDYPISPTLLPIYQEIFVLWLTPFIHANPRACGSDSNGPSEARGSISHGAKFGSSTEDSIMPPALSDTRPFGIEVSSGTQTVSSDLTIQASNEARRSLSSGFLQPSDQTTGLHSSSVDRSQTLHREKPQIGLKEVAMLCAVLYGCRQNINLLHDILHHAFLLPIQCYHALRAVVNVYSSWLEDKANRPIFLQSIEPAFSPQPLPSVDVKQVVAPEMAGRSDSDSSSPVVIGRDGPLGVSDSRRKLQTNISNEELRGCLQTATQIMLYNMARVFLLKCPPAVKTHQADPTGKHSNRTVDYVKEQVDLCRRILYIFRVTSDRNELTSDSWMKLLSFLLEVINSTMIGVAPNGNIGDSWLSNEKLVHTLFQTMNGALLRASLLAPITQDPWNQCLTVYSKLTQWTPLISEWKKVMQSLTTIMAKLVYGVDLSDLPTGNLPRRGKRDLGHHSTNRARPKSFTDSTLAHVPSTNVFQPGAQPPISPQPLTTDPTFSEAIVSISGIDVLRKPCDMCDADGGSEPLSPASPTQTPEGHFSFTTDAGISPSVTISNNDTRSTNRVDSEGKLPKMDSSRHHSLPRTLQQAHRSTTLVPSREPTVFAMHVDLTQTPTKSSFETQNVPRCILAGGEAPGWTQESIVVCWRRFLGMLGNVNDIENNTNLEKVYTYLSELVGVLLKIQQYQKLNPVSDACVQPLAEYCIPIEYVVPTLLEAMLRDKSPSIRLSALSTLCECVIRPPDRPVNYELTAQFYRILHRYLTGTDERYVHGIVRSCGMRFFAADLPASHLLLLDFLRGINVVLTDTSNAKEVPRTEAVVMLSTLLCYPIHFNSLECFDATLSNTFQLTTCTDLGSRVLQSLFRVTLADPNAEARCLALAALAVNIIVQLTHLNAGPDSTVNRPVTFPLDEFVYLLGMMRFQDHSVALVAVDMIHVLSNYCDIILRFNPTLTVCILRTLIWSLTYLWMSINVEKIIPVEKRLLTSFILAITDWTTRLPPHVVRTRIRNSDKTEVESETLISAILNVFYLIICTSPTGVPAESKEPSVSLLKLLSMQPPDPLLDLLHQCETRPDIEAFLVPTSRLDTSSLTIRTFLMASHGHPWTGFQQLGEGGLQAVYSVRLAARVSLCHLLNHLDHYPMDGQGAQLNTTIQETHDQADGLPDADMSDATELSLTTLEQPNIQLFSLNESILLTFLSLPMPNTAPVTSRRALEEPQFHRFPISTQPLSMKPFLLDPTENSSHFEAVLAPTDNFIGVSDVQYTRIIVRDFAGKYSWDLSCLHGLWNGSGPGPTHMSPLGIESSSSTSRHAPPCPPPRLNPNPPPLQPSLVRSSGSPGSPECAPEWDSNVQENGVRRETGSPCFNMEAMTDDQITAQCQLDEEVLEHANRQFQSAAAAADNNSAGTRTVQTNANPSISTSGVSCSPRNDSTSMPDQFAVCRNLINQLGFLSFERRPTIELVQKSAGLVRDLKHLDKFGVRETHKIAVFYVGAGQEDKQSILSNQMASLEFENFLAGLGWEIDLLTHRGFRGGLERSGRAGNSTPYYATATLEVIFHVSTRMPSSTQEDLKYKHLGNDEVMIIWTENARAFTRSVLRTQFGDVLIIISPLSTGLFRVDVRRESMVGFFGPIVHSAVLDACVLPGLVRATAINASRAIRAINPGYRPHYEERAASLKQIISRYAVRSCFEDFAQSLVLPSLPPDSIISELLQQQPDGREVLGGSFRLPVPESYPRQHPGHHQSLAAPFSFTPNVPQHVSSTRAAKSGPEQTSIDVDEHRSSPSSSRTGKHRHHHHDSSSARDGHTSSRRKHRSRSRRTSSKDAPSTAPLAVRKFLDTSYSGKKLDAAIIVAHRWYYFLTSTVSHSGR